MESQDKVVIKKLKQITIISFVFMSVQILGGYYAHSIAIMADAFHLLSDVLGYVVSLWAVYMSYRPSPIHFTFGYEKIQPLGALLNVTVIWVVTVFLFFQATGRIVNHDPVEEPAYMLLTSLFGLCCNFYILRVLHSDPHGSHSGCTHDHSQGNHAHLHQIEASSRITLRSHHNDHEGDHKHDNCHHEHKEEHQNHADHHGNHHEHQYHGNHDNHDPHQHHDHGECGGHNQNGAFTLGETIPKNKDVHLESVESDEDIKTESKSTRMFKNINLEAAHIHIISDIILSIGVILSAIIIYFMAPQKGWNSWQLADPFCTYAFSIMAIYSTIPVTKEAILLLLDGCESPQLIHDIQNELKEHSEIRAVEDLRVWSTNRGKNYAAIKVRVTQQGRGVTQKILKRRGVKGWVQTEEIQGQPLLIAQ